MKLSLGPVLYYWERERVLDFYAQAADWPVEIVYLGEAVCSKRRALRFDDWLEVADRLAAAGKQVVLTTLALVEAESELGAMRRIATNGRYPVEANDVAALNMLDGAGQQFVVGPTLNVYNAETLAVMRDMGAVRWVPPVELSSAALATLLARRPPGIETEVIAFGRLPLALSARCFTARAHRLPKDACEFRCRDYPDGLALSTREGRRFLTLNGIQTQSGGTCNLIAAVPSLHALGVDVLRLSPQADEMAAVVACFDAVRRGALDPVAAERRLEPLLPDGACNGYWHGAPGMAWEPQVITDWPTCGGVTTDC